MKKLLIPLIAIFALTVTANAQGKMGKRGHHGQHQKGMMANQLNFSDDQKKQAAVINEDFRKQMQDLNKQENITVKEMRSRKSAILKDKKARMDGLLTAEQKTKMADMKAAKKLKNEERSAQQLAKMKTNLDLTDAQVSQLKAQRSEMQAKSEKIRNDQSLSMEQKKVQMMALKAEAKEQHNKIFTADQLKKKEEMRKNRGNRSKMK